MEDQSVPQPIEQNKGPKTVWVVVISVIVTALVVGGGIYAWQSSVLKSTKSKLEEQITVLQNQINELNKQVVDKKPQIDNSIAEDNLDNWEKHTGTGLYKYSILAPKGAYVCIGEIATGGSDFGCFPEGVYLEDMKYFPYGVSFEQTALAPDLQNLIDVFGYEGYVQSDINFDNANNQIMIKGSEARKFWDRNNNEIEKTVYYTKYLFTKDGLVYMPKIFTDSEYNDYDLYQRILKTWKFEQ